MQFDVYRHSMWSPSHNGQRQSAYWSNSADNRSSSIRRSVTCSTVGRITSSSSVDADNNWPLLHQRRRTHPPATTLAHRTFGGTYRPATGYALTSPVTGGQLAVYDAPLSAVPQRTLRWPVPIGCAGERTGARIGRVLDDSRLADSVA